MCISASASPVHQLDGHLRVFPLVVPVEVLLYLDQVPCGLMYQAALFVDPLQRQLDVLVVQALPVGPVDVHCHQPLQQLLYRSDCILGAPNIYDGGVSEREDMEGTLEYMRPALVHLYHGLGRGGYSSGSGYIVEIAEDAVYICTNSHVVEKYEDWDIYFYDGTKLPGKQVGISEAYDVGVARVDREDVPEELLERLMTVHIDRTYWTLLNDFTCRETRLHNADWFKRMIALGSTQRYAV